MPESKRKALDELSEEDVVRACELNYIDYWTNIGKARNAEFTDERGMTYCITGLKQDIFNVVLKCDLSDDVVESRIDEALKLFRSRGLPMTWHRGLTTRPRDIGKYLEARGFPYDYDLIAMAVDLGRLKEEHQFKDSIRVELVQDAAKNKAWIECLVSSWNSPMEAIEWLSASPWFNVSLATREAQDFSRRIYLGFVNDQPAATAMINWDDKFVGLQAIGTIPSQRYKGVGTATILAALGDAREMGFRFAVVLATTEGVKLYKRVGYKMFGKLPEHSLHFERMQGQDVGSRNLI